MADGKTVSGKAWFECCVSLHFSLKGRMSVAIHDRRYFREMTNEEFAAFGIDNCSLLEFDLCTEEEQTIYTITRIEEADFGCEGRPEGYVPMVKVYLKNEQGMERVLEMEDAMMYQRKLDEGARVVIGSDKTLHTTEKGR